MEFNKPHTSNREEQLATSSDVPTTFAVAATAAAATTITTTITPTTTNNIDSVNVCFSNTLINSDCVTYATSSTSYASASASDNCIQNTELHNVITSTDSTANDPRINNNNDTSSLMNEIKFEPMLLSSLPLSTSSAAALSTIAVTTTAEEEATTATPCIGNNKNQLLFDVVVATKIDRCKVQLKKEQRKKKQRQQQKKQKSLSKRIVSSSSLQGNSNTRIAILESFIGSRTTSLQQTLSKISEHSSTSAFTTTSSRILQRQNQHQQHLLNSNNSCNIYEQVAKDNQRQNSSQQQQQQQNQCQWQQQPLQEQSQSAFDASIDILSTSTSTIFQQNINRTTTQANEVVVGHFSIFNNNFLYNITDHDDTDTVTDTETDTENDSDTTSITLLSSATTSSSSECGSSCCGLSIAEGHNEVPTRPSATLKQKEFPRKKKSIYWKKNKTNTKFHNYKIKPIMMMIQDDIGTTKVVPKQKLRQQQKMMKQYWRFLICIIVFVNVILLIIFLVYLYLYHKTSGKVQNQQHQQQHQQQGKNALLTTTTTIANPANYSSWTVNTSTVAITIPTASPLSISSNNTIVEKNSKKNLRGPSHINNSNSIANNVTTKEPIKNSTIGVTSSSFHELALFGFVNTSSSSSSTTTTTTTGDQQFHNTSITQLQHHITTNTNKKKLSLYINSGGGTYTIYDMKRNIVWYPDNDYITTTTTTSTSKIVANATMKKRNTNSNTLTYDYKKSKRCIQLHDTVTSSVTDENTITSTNNKIDLRVFCTERRFYNSNDSNSRTDQYEIPLLQSNGIAPSTAESLSPQSYSVSLYFTNMEDDDDVLIDKDIQQNLFTIHIGDTTKPDQIFIKDFNIRETLHSSNNGNNKTIQQQRIVPSSSLSSSTKLEIVTNKLTASSSLLDYNETNVSLIDFKFIHFSGIVSVPPDSNLTIRLLVDSSRHKNAYGKIQGIEIHSM